MRAPFIGPLHEARWNDSLKSDGELGGVDRVCHVKQVSTVFSFSRRKEGFIGLVYVAYASFGDM